MKRVALALSLIAGLGLTLPACAVKPKEKVAAGEETGLVAKSDLLGRPLAEVAGATGVQAGKLTRVSALPAGVAAYLAPLGADPATLVTVDVSESYVTISLVQSGALPEPKLQYKIGGHYDLLPRTDSDGVKSNYLVRNSSENARWQDRAYVELDATDPLKIKADEKTLENLYLVDSVKDVVKTLESDKEMTWAGSDGKMELALRYGVKAGTTIKTTLTQSRFSVYKVEGGTLSIVAQASVRYFDLVRGKNAKEELTPDLERQATQDWFKRLYVEIDPADLEVMRPGVDLMKNLFEKSDLVGKSFILGTDTIPVLSANPRLLANLKASRVAPVKDGDVITLDIREDALDVLAGGKLVVKYTAGHFDIATDKTADGEELGRLVRNTDKPWAQRRYLAVDPTDPDMVFVTEDVLENSHKIVAKKDLAGKCFAPSEIPLPGIAAALAVPSSALVCFELTQTVLSVFQKDGDAMTLLATFVIEQHFDLDYLRSADGAETMRVIGRVQGSSHWGERAFISINLDAPQKTENLVQPDALVKNAFDGEFVYTATVTAAHSENGLVFEGLSLQSSDRLRLEFSEDAMTAYKLHEKLNDSAAPTPVLRFGASHFDVERVKNFYGDRTNVIAETRDRPWAERGHVRVDFASNQIPSYFNDMLGLEKLYYGVTFHSRSRLASEIKVDGDLISFETEEVVTPNAAAGNFGTGETFLEPTAIRIKHAFLRVGKRGYQPKEYDNFAFQKFGYFRTTEFGIDPVHGKTDQALKHYIQRFDTSGDKKIVYYLNKDFPESFKDEAREVVAAWNKAFEAAIGRANVVVLDESMTPDFGDPRYNMIVHLPSRSEMSPLGYGPATFDPTTGEHISAKAYMYGDAVKYVMRTAGDFYDLATGARSPDSFAVGSERPAVSGSAGSSPMARVPAITARNKPAEVVAPTFQAFALPRTQAGAKAARDLAPGGSPLRAVNALKKLESSAIDAQAILASEMKKALPATLQGLNPSFADGNKLAFGHHQGCAMMPEVHLASAIKFIQAHPDKTKAEVLAELESRMYFTTLLHEVGHNLGLRHNFKGSFDELNFPNEYHELKLLGAIGLPDPIGPGEWLYKYRGSSVMEYSDDYEAVDKKAGPYDIAAIKFGYGDKLEKVTGQNDFGALVTEDVPLARFEATKREIAAQDPTLSASMLDRVTTMTMGIRPYQFCTDEHTLDDPTCKRFDRGVTVAETTQSLIEDYDTLYWLYGFRRDRRTFTGSSSRVIGRFIMPIRQLVDEYIYGLIFNTFAESGAGSQDDYLKAVNLGIGFFRKILDTVEPGTYHLDAKGELVSGRSEEEGAKNVVVDLMTGKHLLSQIEMIGGEERVLSRGIELDKIGVLWAMSMRGYPAPKYERASLSLNYFDLLKEFSMNTFSGIMRDDTTIDLVATRKDANSDFIAQPAGTRFTAGNPNQMKAKIRPATSLTLKEYATLFSVIDYGSSSDRTFSDYIDFRIKGIDSALPEGTPTVEFKSASGLKTYVVADTADKLSISFKVAQKAAEQAAIKAKAEADLKALPTTDELKAAVIAKFGQAWAIGFGEPMGDDIVGILMGNFDGNIEIVVGMMSDWIAEAATPEDKAKLEALAAGIAADLTQYKGIAEQAEAIQGVIDGATRELTSLESDLIHYRDLFKIFN